LKSSHPFDKSKTLNLNPPAHLTAFNSSCTKVQWLPDARIHGSNVSHKLQINKQLTDF